MIRGCARGHPLNVVGKALTLSGANARGKKGAGESSEVAMFAFYPRTQKYWRREICKHLACAINTLLFAEETPEEIRNRALYV